MSDVGGSGRAARFYRLLLRVLPRDMRLRFGAAMEELFLVRLGEAGGSIARSSAVWLRAVGDLALQAVALRMEDIDMGEWTMGSLVQDVRHGIRAALAAPAFALLAVVTLALGVGASTATFSVVHAALLRDLPFDEPERLVFVWPDMNTNKATALLAEERMPSLSGVSGLSAWTLTLTGIGEPRELTGMLVSPSYFDILGVRPALGRAFVAGEDLPGAAGVVVLSHDFWTGAFGADPTVVGRVIDLGGAEYERREVIGVMPPGVEQVWRRVDVWIPLEGDRALGLAEDNSWYVNERLGRLAPGATVAQAIAEVREYAAEVRRGLPGQVSEEDVNTATIRGVREHMAGTAGAAMWVALGAVGLVLLIACFNVANLLLARGDSRAGDLAVRAALGAGRLRVSKLLLTEASVIGIAGGGLGVLAAMGLIRLVVRLAPESFPGIESVSLNPAVLFFAVAVTIASVLGAGIVPAVRVGRTDAASTLGGRARGAAGRSGGRLTPFLVGGQVALAVLVTIGSGLMLRSLSALVSVDPGIDGAGVLAFKPNPPAGRYPDGDAFREYYDLVRARVADIPEVESVGAINLLPGTTNNWSFPTFPEGFDVPEGSPTPSVNFRAVSGDYFETVRIPRLAGRTLTDADNADASLAVLVNEAFVDAFWPGLEPLGRTLSIFSPQGARYSVVGLVADVRQHGRAAAPRPEMYFSQGQVPWDQMSMWIMAGVRSGDPLESAALVRDVVWSVDPDVPIADMADLAEVMSRSTRTTSFLTALLAAFGALALVLCAVGVFGVATYTSALRRPEFGVRIALGSSRGLVVRSALRRSLLPVAGGLVLGLAGATLTSRLLAAVLFDVEPTDLVTFGAVALVLGSVGALATVLPAWWASRVDPITVLGAE